MLLLPFGVLVLMVVMIEEREKLRSSFYLGSQNEPESTLIYSRERCINEDVPCVPLFYDVGLASMVGSTFFSLIIILTLILIAIIYRNLLPKFPIISISLCFIFLG